MCISIVHKADSEALSIDLIQDHLVLGLGGLKTISDSKEIYEVGLLLQAQGALDFSHLLHRHSFNLELDLEASSKLVFDMLRAAEAVEEAASTHDSHLTAKGFRLFHGVRGQ